MMDDMECPYCRKGQEVCHDDGEGYDESKRHSHTCSGCDKTFVFTTRIIYYYEPAKADCLNGSEHQLKMSRALPREYSSMCCKYCEYERTPTTKEFAAAGIIIQKNEEAEDGS